MPYGSENNCWLCILRLLADILSNTGSPRKAANALLYLNSDRQRLRDFVLKRCDGQ